MLLYQVVRLEPKDFRCRRPDGAGGWTGTSTGCGGALPPGELAEAPRVYIPEGEKDATRSWPRAHGDHESRRRRKWRGRAHGGPRAAACLEVIVLRDNDSAGRGARGRRRPVPAPAAGLSGQGGGLPGLPPCGEARRGRDRLARGRPLPRRSWRPSPPPPPWSRSRTRPSPPPRRRRPSPGRSCAARARPRAVWPDGVRFTLSAIRDGREGVRGELTVTQDGRRLSWGALALSSTPAREALRKRLEAVAPGLPWGELPRGGGMPADAGGARGRTARHADRARSPRRPASSCPGSCTKGSRRSSTPTATPANR